MYQTSTDLHSIIVLQFDPMKVKKRTKQNKKKENKKRKLDQTVEL